MSTSRRTAQQQQEQETKDQFEVFAPETKDQFIPASSEAAYTDELPEGSQDAGDFKTPENHLEVLAPDFDLDTYLSRAENSEQYATDLTARAEFISMEAWPSGEKRSYLLKGFEMVSITNKVTAEVENYEAARLVARDRSEWLTSNKMLVNNLRKVEVLPCAVVITYTGKVKGKNGFSYHNFKVLAFDK